MANREPISKLTKQQIADYYSDPEVQAAILKQIKGRPLLAVQSLPTGNVYRRNADSGSPIRIVKAVIGADDPSNLDYYTTRRFSEFHPSIGKNSREVWVDIDPGPNVGFNDTKIITEKVFNHFKKFPGVSDCTITFSGGRGFHIRGTLAKKQQVDETRRQLDAHLKQMNLPGAVFRKPTGSEFRLDTSTLQNNGSLRAAYSLNSTTGNVALPLTARELKGFTPDQAAVSRVLREKEFAPGIPRAKRVYAMPVGNKPTQKWTLSIQKHDADKAGLHWDLRLVDTNTGFAHSWALPKAKFPTPGERPVLAIRTPTHTAHYSLNFGSNGPQTIGKGYGKGTVEIVHQEPITVVSSDRDTIKFISSISGQPCSYRLFKTNGDNWLLIASNAGQEKEEITMQKTSAYQAGIRHVLIKLGLDSDSNLEQQGAELSGPVDYGDAEMPVGQLTAVIDQMCDGDEGGESAEEEPEPLAINRVETRLNRPAQWSAPSAVPVDEYEQVSY